MKKTALVSLVPDPHLVGIEYAVFNEIALDYCEKKGKVKNLVKDIFLPVVKALNHDVVLFDMQPLMHDEVVVALRDKYDLYWLNCGGELSGAAKTLQKEYEQRLSKICKGEYKWLKKITE